MHLFDLDKFGTRFGIDMTVTDFYNAVSESSQSATLTLASLFRFGDFEPYTLRRDMFQVDRMFEGGNTSNRSFSLSRGIVTSGTVTAYYSSTPLNLRNNDLNSLVDLTDTDEDGESDHMVIDYASGLITVFGLALRGLWVLVDYSGGFDINSNAEYEDVPPWLADAAINQTALNLQHHRAFKADADDESDFTELQKTVDRYYASNARLHLSAVKPTASEAGS